MLPQFKTILLLCLCASQFSACTQTESPTTNVRPALAYKIGSGSANTEILAGDIHARFEADLAFRISGKINSRLVDAGARVKRGQALASIDAADTKLNVDAAKANAMAAETDAKTAQDDYQRYRDLAQKGFVSAALRDQKLNLADAAKARWGAAKSQMELAQNQTAYTTIHADDDGVVTQVFAEAGQVVAAGQAILRVANPLEKELALSISESRIAQFRKAPKPTFRVALWSAPTVFYAAHLREIAASADPITRTYAARLAIAPPHQAIELGMTGYAISATAALADTLTVPLSALLIKGNVASVWLIGADGKLSSRSVTVRQYRETNAEVSGNIVLGNVIVAAGGHKLHEGEFVKPLFDATITGDGKVIHVGVGK